MTPLLALDTSVAVPLLVSSHGTHAMVDRWWAGREVRLSGHALAETYSVLTRLPGDAAYAPADAVRLMRERFAAPLLLGPDATAELPEALARLEVTGGAVYDALVGLAAAEHGAVLATRDARARSTYERIGVDIELVV